MPLNPATGATAANNALIAQIDKQNNGEPITPQSDMAKQFATAYHNYAKAATLPGADCTAGGILSILESAFISDNTAATIDRIALGLCNYWSSFITPGAPAHGGISVVSVVVNGAVVFAAMKAAVTALVTNQLKPDGWIDFYNATEAVVRTIPCVITEIIPGTPPVPTPFPETIS